MKSSTLSKKLKVVLSEKKLNKPGKNIGFSQRLRQITPFAYSADGEHQF